MKQVRVLTKIEKTLDERAEKIILEIESDAFPVFKMLE